MVIAFAMPIVTFQHTPTLAAQPSFDCRTATTLREQAVCRDERLATLDHALSQGYLAGLQRVGPVAAPALRRDQAHFIELLDGGFDVQLIGKNAPEPRTATAKLALRAIFATRRDKETLIPSLERHLQERIEMLRGIEIDRAGFVGTWRSHQATLIVKPPVDGAYESTFQYNLWGRFTDRCQLQVSFVADGSALSAAGIRNMDLDGQIMKRPLLVTKGDTVLRLKEPWPDDKTPLPWACPRLPGIEETMWPVRSNR